MFRPWAITVICAALLVFAPLAFGSVEVWSKTVLQVGGILLLLVFLLPGRGITRGSRPRAPVLVIALFLLLILVQLTPLPERISGAVSAKSMELKRTGSEGYQSKSRNLPGAEKPAHFSVLSMYPEATKEELLLLFTYVLVFFSVGYGGLRREQRTTLYATIISMGYLVALLGLIQEATGTPKIFWLRTLRYGGNPFGSFVNRNHFAGFANMCIGLTLGALVGVFQPWRSEVFKARARFFNYLSSKEFGLSVLLVFMSAVMTASVFAASSRGGVLSLVVGFVLFFVLVVASRSQRKSLFLVVPLIAIVFIATLLLVHIEAFNRLFTLQQVLETDVIAASRPAIWKDTLNMARDFPVVGTGLGTFAFVFPIYRSFYTSRFCLHAHSDWIQLASETGLPGLCLVIAFIIIVVAYVARGMRQNRDPVAWGLMVGGLTALAIIFAHSFVDFNLHIPSNALYLTVILALTLATARGRRRARISQVRTEFYAAGKAFTGWYAARCVVWAVLLVGLSGWWTWELVYHQRAQQQLEGLGSYLEEQEQADAVESDEAVLSQALASAQAVTRWAGKNAEYYFEVSRDLLRFIRRPVRSSSTAAAILQRMVALDRYGDDLRTFLGSACRLNPIVGEHHYWLAQMCTVGLLLEQAEREFLKAVALSPSNVKIRLDLVWFYQSIGEPDKAEPHLRVVRRLARDNEEASDLLRDYEADMSLGIAGPE